MTLRRKLLNNPLQSMSNQFTEIFLKNAVIYGTLLGLENYIQKHKTGSEGVIVNISSIAGVEPFSKIPIYVGTKFFVLGASESFGDPLVYERTKVKVLTLCPGVTLTPLITEMAGRNLGPDYDKISLGDIPTQEPHHVASALVEIVKNAQTGTAWIAEGGEPPYEFKLMKRENCKN